MAGTGSTFSKPLSTCIADVDLLPAVVGAAVVGAAADVDLLLAVVGASVVGAAVVKVATGDAAVDGAAVAAAGFLNTGTVSRFTAAAGLLSTGTVSGSKAAGLLNTVCSTLDTSLVMSSPAPSSRSLSIHTYTAETSLVASSLS